MYRTRLAVDLLRSGYRVRFRVMGTSMVPAIPPGSLVQIEPIDPALLRPGEIVLTNGNGRLIAHRIERIHTGARGGLSFVLRGDNVPHSDRPVGGRAVLGRVVCLVANDNWASAAWATLLYRFGEARRALARAA